MPRRGVMDHNPYRTMTIATCSPRRSVWRRAWTRFTRQLALQMHERERMTPWWMRGAYGVSTLFIAFVCAGTFFVSLPITLPTYMIYSGWQIREELRREKART